MTPLPVSGCADCADCADAREREEHRRTKEFHTISHQCSYSLLDKKAVGMPPFSFSLFHWKWKCHVQWMPLAPVIL